MNAVRRILPPRRRSLRRGGARVHARRNVGGYHDHRPDHGVGGTASVELLKRIEGQDSEDSNRKLLVRARSILSGQRPLPLLLGRSSGARAAAGEFSLMERAISQDCISATGSLGPTLSVSVAGDHAPYEITSAGPGAVADAAGVAEIKSTSQ